MTPPVFRTCAASDEVRALLGENPTRLYGFRLAPPETAPPYAVWQVVGGTPENYLGNLPDVDQMTVRLVAFAETAEAARDVAIALRDAIEPVATLTAWFGDDRDAETNLLVVGFLVDWFVHRTT